MNKRHKGDRRDTYQTVQFPRLRRVLALMYPAARFVSRLRELVESGYGLHTREGEQLVVAR